MSKGTRKREANAIKQQQRLEREKFEANKRKVRKITAIITSVLILGFVLLVIGGLIINNVRLNRGEYLRNKIAVASDNIEVDGAMMNYYFNDNYNSFLNYYGSNITYYGLDPSLSLKQQQVSEGQTWFEYFMSGAKNTVSSVLILNEAAMADGVSLTEAEQAAVRSRADRTDKRLYGRGTNNDDIYNATALEALAYKYQLINERAEMPTDDEINARYEENAKNYQFVDYLAYPIKYAAEDNADGTRTADEAKVLADKLLAATTADEFKAAVREILVAETADITEEKIESQLSSLAVTNAQYAENNEILDWAFEASVNETFAKDDTENSTYTVYMLTKEANRNENVTINVRHVLLYDSVYGSREKALAKAEELLASFESGDKSADSFALLALEYSEDPGSYYSGGLYMNVEQGYMVESFDQWCFDANRKAGDTGIVESDYGVHVMYFDGIGEEAWAASVTNDIVTERIENLSKEWTEAHSIVFDDTVLDIIPG